MQWRRISPDQAEESRLKGGLKAVKQPSGIQQMIGVQIIFDAAHDFELGSRGGPLLEGGLLIDRSVFDNRSEPLGSGRIEAFASDVNPRAVDVPHSVAGPDQRGPRALAG